jgi:hypothetical protein
MAVVTNATAFVIGSRSMGIDLIEVLKARGREVLGLTRSLDAAQHVGNAAATNRSCSRSLNDELKRSGSPTRTHPRDKGGSRGTGVTCVEGEDQRVGGESVCDSRSAAVMIRHEEKVSR